MFKELLSKIVFFIIALLIIVLGLILNYEYHFSLIEKILPSFIVGITVYGLYKYIKKNESVFYVHIYKNRIVIQDILNKQETEIFIKEKFNSAISLVVDDFSYIEKHLNNGFKKYFKQKWYKPKPVIFIHAMETQEGELSESETQAFVELAFSIGVKKAFVITGPKLSDDILLEKVDEE